MTTPAEAHHQRLFETLQALLRISATAVRPALEEAADLLLHAFYADKVDIFLLDPASSTLVALGVSNTPVGRQQKALGLDRLPLANKGRAVEVFETGHPYREGQVGQDTGELIGIREGLGIRSNIMVPLAVDSERRGLLSITSLDPDIYSAEDLHFLETVAQWVGMILHRAELVEQHTQEVAARTRIAVAEEIVVVLAHDLSNHLTPLSVRLDLLLRRAARDERLKDVHDAEHARAALRHLSALIRDLLDVARLDQGVFALEQHLVDLVALVRDSAALLGSAEHPIDLHAPDELCIEADAARLRQVLDNVLGNAIKHSLPGTRIQIDVATETREDGAWVVVAVRDAGPGIDPALLPHLFERFSKGRQSMGMGLGLHIAYRLAAAHGGTLAVSSTSQEGTTFQLSLPYVPV